MAYPTIPETMMTTSAGIEANGMVSTRTCARPVFIRAVPRARPPATIQSTSQLISLKSFLEKTPVATKIAKGMRATSLELSPVIFSGMSQSTMVITKVAATTQKWKSFLRSALISSLISLALKGKNKSRKNQAISSITITKGTILRHHSPKPISIPRFSFR